MSSPLRDRDWPACAPGARGLRCDGPAPAAWAHPDVEERHEAVLDQIGRAIAHLRVVRRVQRAAQVDRARVAEQLAKAVAHVQQATRILEAAASPADAPLLSALARPRAWIEAELETLAP